MGRRRGGTRKETLYRAGQGPEALCTFLAGLHPGLRSCPWIRPDVLGWPEPKEPLGSHPNWSLLLASTFTEVSKSTPCAEQGWGVAVIKLSRRLVCACGAGSTLSLKYAGYAEVDPTHLNSRISILFLKGSTSSESFPPSQRG